MKPEFYTPQVLKAYHTSSKRLSTGSGRRPLKYQHRTPRASATEIAHWSRGKTRRKASGKTVKRKGTNQRKRRKVMTTSKEPSIQSAKRDPNEFARVGFIFKFLPSALIEQIFAFLLFLRPGFLTNFCPRRLLSFRWIHNMHFHGFYIQLKNSLIPTA